jgi:serine/threonine protein kinase
MNETIGKFSLERKLGEGATAEVYLGRDAFTGRQVAIKIARQASAAQQGRQFQDMFLNEVALTGRMQHPHIVGLYDAGVEQDRLYVIMEYVPGGTLQDYANPANLLPRDRLLDLMVMASNALGYAAEKGVLHRDLKPANLLYLDGKGIKVTDFGTALMQHSEREQLQGMMGTPAYLSPEMILGQDIDQRSDIFALGVVFHQLLCGRLPFQGRTPQELFDAILHQPLTARDRLAPELPDAINEILQGCLARDPSQRYSTWDALQGDLISAHQELCPAEDELTHSQKFALLKRTPFFRDLNDRQLWEIISISYWYRLPPNEVLIEEGSSSGALYFIASGSARVEKNGKVLGQLASGYSIGELSYIQGAEQRRTASVISNETVDLIEIEPRDLEESSDHLQSSIKTLWLKVLADRLAKLTDMNVKDSL